MSAIPYIPLDFIPFSKCIVYGLYISSISRVCNVELETLDSPNISRVPALSLQLVRDEGWLLARLLPSSIYQSVRPGIQEAV